MPSCTTRLSTARTQLCWDDLIANETRFVHRRLAQDARASDVHVERDDRQARGGQTDSVLAAARFARPPLECQRCGQWRPWYGVAYFAHRGEVRLRKTTASRVVPGHTDVAERAGRKRQLGLDQSLVGQIENGTLVNEHRPTRAVTAAFEADPFEKRRGNPVDTETIDHDRLSEIDLESAGLCCGRLHGRHGQRLRRTPHGLLGRIRHEQILQLLFVGIEEAQVGQPNPRRHAAAKRTAAAQQRDVDRETTRAGPASLNWTLVAEHRVRCRLLRRRCDHEQCPHVERDIGGIMILPWARAARTSAAPGQPATARSRDRQTTPPGQDPRVIPCRRETP